MSDNTVSSINTNKIIAQIFNNVGVALSIVLAITLVVFPLYKIETSYSIYSVTGLSAITGYETTAFSVKGSIINFLPFISIAFLIITPFVKALKPYTKLVNIIAPAINIVAPFVLKSSVVAGGSYSGDLAWGYWIFLLLNLLVLAIGVFGAKEILKQKDKILESIQKNENK